MKIAQRFLLACVVLFQAGAHAQAAYPTRPIRVVIQFAPGGSDVVARILTHKMTDALGQSFVIDNRPGAAGVIASGIVAKAAPDGYTLLFSTASFAVTAAYERNLPYDSVRDFDAVGFIGSQPFMLLLHLSVQANSVKEFIALSRAKPMAYGSTGGGGIGHLTHELFNHMAGIAQSTHVPYKGSGPIVTALLAAEVPSGMVNLSSAYGQVRSGKLKALAITTLKRSAFAPELPTLAESGLPGFESGTWYGLTGPLGMPPAAIHALNREMTAALKTDIKEKLAVLGVDLAPSSPQWFATYIRDEIAKWSKVIKYANVRVE